MNACACTHMITHTRSSCSLWRLQSVQDEKTVAIGPIARVDAALGINLEAVML